jgi:hypothetical protein
MHTINRALLLLDDGFVDGLTYPRHYNMDNELGTWRVVGCKMALPYLHYP